MASDAKKHKKREKSRVFCIKKMKKGNVFAIQTSTKSSNNSQSGDIDLNAEGEQVKEEQKLIKTMGISKLKAIK